MIDVIYCADGNETLANIAIEAGWLYGARLPGTVYVDPGLVHFADIDFKNRPRRELYLEYLDRYRPYMASVPDWDTLDELDEVLEWAEAVAPYVQEIIIIPKVRGEVSRLPSRVAGTPIRLGYSVPTSYGGTEVPIWEFEGWPVHLLGGSPHQQMMLTGARFNNQRRGRARFYQFGLAGFSVFKPGQVVSADGNMMQLMATKYCQFWVPGTSWGSKNRWWPTLKEAEGQKWINEEGEHEGAHFEAFRRSCLNILQAWQTLAEGEIV